MNTRIFPTTAIVLIVTAPAATYANQYSRDRDEETKRAIEKVDKYEQDQQDAAAKRYDARNQSSGDGSFPVFGTVMFLVLLVTAFTLIGIFCKNTDGN